MNYPNANGNVIYIAHVYFRYFYRACQGSLFPNPVQVGRQLDRLPADMRRLFLSQSRMKLGSLGSLFTPPALFFPLCRPFQKDYRPRMKQAHVSGTKQKEKAIASPIPSKTVEMWDTPLSSKTSGNHVILNLKTQDKAETCRPGSDSPLSVNLDCAMEASYTKDPPASRTVLEAILSPVDLCQVRLLTSTPLLCQTESIQLLSPPSSCLLEQKVEDEDGSNQNSLLLKGGGDTQHNQEHSVKTTFL